METCSILICAYNEEKNIENIINDILCQSASSEILLENIIIVSDGSTDNTNKILSSFKEKITFIKNEKRIGKPLSFNKGKILINSNYLISLDADIRLKGKDFFINLGEFLGKNSSKNIGLIGGEVIPGFQEKYNLTNKASLGSYYINYYLRKSLNNFNNFYSAHGRCLVLNKKLYKDLILPNSPGTDQFMYFSCIRNGFSFLYGKDLIVEYKLPNNFFDYSKQSNRFRISISNMKKYFGEEFVEKELRFPIFLKIKIFLKLFSNHFVIFISWIFYYLFSKIKGIIFKDGSDGLWNISKTTKLFLTFNLGYIFHYLILHFTDDELSKLLKIYLIIFRAILEII